MNWILPSLEEEMGEFERTAQEYGIRLDVLISLFQSGTLVDLDEWAWSRLENTDSGRATSFKEMLEVAARGGRNAQPIFRAFLARAPMQAPIVLNFAGNRTLLVSGNTRLMVSRFLCIRPKVFKI